MVRGIGLTFLRWAPWAVAAVAAAVTVRGLLAQVALQESLNGAMQGVHRNIKEARVLTARTAAALAPLASTSASLQAMNDHLRATRTDLRAMNETMVRISPRQEAILARLDSLNDRTGAAVTALGEIDGKNKQLLGTTSAMTAQTRRQAGALENLAGLTDESVVELNRLNRKFAFLRRF